MSSETAIRRDFVAALAVAIAYIDGAVHTRALTGHISRYSAYNALELARKKGLLVPSGWRSRGEGKGCKSKLFSVNEEKLQDVRGTLIRASIEIGSVVDNMVHILDTLYDAIDLAREHRGR